MEYGYLCLPLLEILLAIPKSCGTKVFWETIVLCLISIGKFGSLKNPCAAVADLSKLELWQKLFTHEKEISALEVEGGLIWLFDFDLRDIKINFSLKILTKLRSNSKSTHFKNILSWDIPLIIITTIPISTRVM